jgi:hypothetical protein
MRALVLLGAVLAVGACTKKPKECKQVVNIIDDDDDKLSVAAAGMGSDPQSVIKSARDIAGIEDKLAADLGALTITTPDVKKGSDDYVSVAKDLSTAMKSIADALDKVAGNMDAKTDPVSRALIAQQKLQDRCDDKPKLPECKKLRETRVPKIDADNPTVTAEELNALLARFQGLTITDDEVKNDLDDYEAVLSDVIAYLKTLTSYQTSIQQLKVRSEQATAEINTACTGSP